MGGSLRCPANFCNVVGLRTSPGRVPVWPAKTGWTEGLPVGVQIVGRHQDDFGVLLLAYAFEQATELWKRRAPIAAAN